MARSMASQTAPVEEKIQLSVAKTRRDYHLSLALLVAGIVDAAAFYAYTSWASSTGNYPSSTLVGVTIVAIGEASYVLILVGAIFEGVNWSINKNKQQKG